MKLFDGFRVLAIDPSTSTGYAVIEYQNGKKTILLSGKLKKVEDEKDLNLMGVYFVTLLTLLNDIQAKYQVNAVTFETSFTSVNPDTNTKLARVSGVVILFAGMHSIPVFGIPVARWRKYLYQEFPREGKGAYNKDEVFKTIHQHIKAFDGFEESYKKCYEENNDEADAIGIGFAFFEFVKDGCPQPVKKKRKSTKKKADKTK